MSLEVTILFGRVWIVWLRTIFMRTVYSTCDAVIVSDDAFGPPGHHVSCLHQIGMVVGSGPGAVMF